MAADEPSSKPGPFDVPTIKALVALMSRHDLAEIDLREGELRIRLRRGLPGAASTPPPVVVASVAAPVPTPQSAAVPDVPAMAAEKSPKGQHLIKSPTPGTFYSAPNPGAEPFVREGSRVTPSTVIGLIEAMKLFNEINAECTGVIREVLVDNQQAVEFGQPLFRVELTS